MGREGARGVHTGLRNSDCIVPCRTCIVDKVLCVTVCVIVAVVVVMLPVFVGAMLVRALSGVCSVTMGVPGDRGRTSVFLRIQSRVTV